MSDLPQKLYKFMEPKWLKQLQETKRFYINHLNNYKQSELGNQVGDDSEGTMSTNFNIGKYTFNGQSQNRNPAFEHMFYNAQRLVNIGLGSNVTFENVSIVTNYKKINYYVYCMCLENDNAIRNEWGGAALVINNFPMFLQALNSQLHKKYIRYLISDPCQYVKNRKFEYSEIDKQYMINYPYMIKDTRYLYQKEYRIIWKNLTKKEIKEPIFLRCPEALKYCDFEF